MIEDNQIQVLRKLAEEKMGATLARLEELFKDLPNNVKDYFDKEKISPRGLKEFPLRGFKEDFFKDVEERFKEFPIEEYGAAVVYLAELANYFDLKRKTSVLN